MKTIAAVVCLALNVLVCSVQAASLEGPATFDQFKLKFNKQYPTLEEEVQRRQAFESNIEGIRAFNEEEADKAGYTLEVNHLADLLPSEYQAMNGFKVPAQGQLKDNTPQAEAFFKSVLARNVSVPDELDWRNVENRVSAVKSQGQCGSCWAFATVATLEGQEVPLKKISDKNLEELSEQDLVDCSKSNFGCDGGFMQAAFVDIAKKQGIQTEASYLYRGRQGKCKYTKDKAFMSDLDGYILPMADEEMLKTIVAKYGPVSVAIDASSNKFQFYKNGVYYNRYCKNKPDQLDHAVLVVGYGTDATSGDYWIVKNSWAAIWGEKGYVRMARNKKNHCGIATLPTIATFSM